MTTQKEKKCADLVLDKMIERSSQLNDINTIISDVESSEEQVEEALEELNNLALEISSFKVIKILLSTGGPADWLELEIDDEGSPRRLTYHYSDWFDHAEIKVPEKSYLWDYAMQIAELEI